MTKNYLLNFILFVLVLNASAQIGYYDAPYVRYEANVGTLVNATTTSSSFNQGLLQSEASEQICVNLSNSGASVSWNVSAPGDGLVVRYSVPDGQSGTLEVFMNSVSVGTMNLSTYYSWEYLSSNGNPNNVGVTNTNPKMRFDEVRMRLPSVLPAGGNLRLVRTSGNIHIDFAELELVPPAVTASGGNAVYSGDGSNLQTFIDANGGNTIYIPPGVYNVNRDLFFGVNNTSIRGAGMWYTQLHFTSGAANDGGLWGQASNISYSGLYLTTVRNSRSNSYKGINGVYTGGVTLSNIWVEHFECGAWIANYGVGPTVADNFTVINCRFRNNYADGINLCKGTRNAIVEHCSFRNNGDDDMAIWSANGQECQNNTFRYNTSENTWRASGVAIYGGLSNKAHNILIQDNVEVGIKVNNAFGGAPFNASGLHELYNIIIKRCGTNHDLFHTAVGAIEIASYDYGAGLRVQNVRFSCIDIIDSKNDAISIKKATAGSDGMYNLVFQNITINGTGREYPDNGGAVAGRGYMVKFTGSPGGSATYCGMSYTNRGGSAGSDFTGTYSWNAAGGACPGGCNLTPSSTTITSPTNGSSFDGCPVGPISITATSVVPSGNTVSYIEFFVDGNSIGTDNSSPYTLSWSSPTNGNHIITAVSHYSPSNTTSTSINTNITVGASIKLTSAAPVIDGTIDGLWTTFAALNLYQGFNSSPDLAGYYRIAYDATNLYILVDVTDDVRIRDGSGGTWEDDGVEIYIDYGNQKPTTYAASDFQYSFNWNSTTIIENKWNATAGVTLGQANRTGGYVMEMRIPWSTIGGTPAAGSYIGFDVKINDDDNNGTRDNELGWYDGSFNAWSNPALLGTLQFSSCSPLPVEVLELYGQKEKKSVVLNWITVNESNRNKFTVERSADLTTWITIGEIKESNQGKAINEYYHTDYNPLNGKSYYRIRQLDSDEQFNLSNVVQIYSNDEAFYFSPNPFESDLLLNYSGNGNVVVTIRDVSGKLILQFNTVIEKEWTSFTPVIPSGVYIITLQTNDYVGYQKVVKK